MKKIICILVCCLLIGCGSPENISLEDAILAAEEMEEERKQPETMASSAEEKPAVCYVYVCGEVVNPGVYMLEPDSRIVAAIEAAGGFLESAATEAVNLAEPLQDGMQIIVPNLEEYQSSAIEEKREAEGLININTATVTELCSLSGIGEAKAEAILAYRRELGGFTSTAQLKEVSGIGDSLFEQIKEDIYIE